MQQLLISVIIFSLTTAMLTFFYSLYSFHRDKQFYKHIKPITMTEFESTIQNIKQPTPIVIQIKKSEEDLIFDIINKLKNIYLIQKVMVLYVDSNIHVCVTLTKK